MTAAWALALPPTRKLVLLALADNASDEGQCFPALATLARKSGLSERAIRAAISALEAAGHVTRHERPGRSTVYRIHPGTTCPPAGDAPRQQMPAPRHEMPDTPAHGAPTPARGAPITVIEPSRESSPERGTRRSSVSASAKAAQRCPADFAVTPEMRAWASAECPRVDVDRETALFRDHEFARARTDWPAAWRNWMRRAEEIANSWPSSPRGAPSVTPKQLTPEWRQLREDASRAGFRDEYAHETPEQFRAKLKKFQDTMAKGALTKLGTASALKAADLVTLGGSN